MKILPKTPLLLTLLLAGALHANPVDFTTGFTPGALDGQNDWATNGNLVAGVGGISDNSGFNHGLLTTATTTMSLGDSVTSIINFTYDVGADSTGSGKVVNAAFHNSSDPTVSTGEDVAIHNRLGGTVHHANTGVRLILYQNWGNRSPAENGVDAQYLQSGVFANSLVGLDPFGADPMSVDGDEDLVSDDLQVSLQLTAGLTVDDWTATITLTNLTTAMVVGTQTRTNISFDALGSPLFGGFGFGNNITNVNGTSRLVSRYEFISEPLVSGSASEKFTIANGYADGGLGAHGDWDSEGSTVDTTAETTTIDAFEESIFSGLKGFYIDGTTYKASMTFSFSDDATYTPPVVLGDPITDVSPSGKPFLNVGIFNLTESSATGAGIAFDVSELFSNEVIATTTTDHGLEVGDTVFVENVGFVTTDPNGSFVVTAVDDSVTFRYALTGADETYTAGGDATPTDSPSLRAGFVRSGNAYRLKLQTGWNSFSGTGNRLPSISGVEGTSGELQTATFATTEVGIDRNFLTLPEADLDSDNLKLTLSLTAGATNDSWTATIELFNLDSGTPAVAVASKTIGPITSFNANSLYAGFGGGQGDGNAKVSNRLTSCIEYEVIYPTVTPTGDVEIDTVSFDGTTLTVTFTGAVSTSYKLTENTDLIGLFTDTGEVESTDVGGIGSFSYVVGGGPPAKSFFQVKSN